MFKYPHIPHRTGKTFGNLVSHTLPPRFHVSVSGYELSIVLFDWTSSFQLILCRMILHFLVYVQPLAAYQSEPGFQIPTLTLMAVEFRHRKTKLLSHSVGSDCALVFPTFVLRRYLWASSNKVITFSHLGQCNLLHSSLSLSWLVPSLFLQCLTALLLQWQTSNYVREVEVTSQSLVYVHPLLSCKSDVMVRYPTIPQRHPTLEIH
jgi:hypothetical protein